MTELSWEKIPEKPKHKLKRNGQSERLKFLISGVLILGAVAFLIFSGTTAGARYFITVDEIVGNSDYVGETVRITGAVIGESIEYNPADGELRFTVVNMPEEFDDLATALHAAVEDPNGTRLSVYIEDETKPDLLQHEAQAILTGSLGDDGVFYATELLLKCPSRFEENVPGNMIHLQDS